MALTAAHGCGRHLWPFYGNNVKGQLLRRFSVGPDVLILDRGAKEALRSARILLQAQGRWLDTGNWNGHKVAL